MSKPLDLSQLERLIDPNESPYPYLSSMTTRRLIKECKQHRAREAKDAAKAALVRELIQQAKDAQAVLEAGGVVLDKFDAALAALQEQP